MITFIRKSLLNAYTALPLLVCLLVVTWTSQAKPLTVNHHYSGEEMFRGLFFLEGSYAEHLPELKSLSLNYSYKLAKSADKAMVNKTRDQIIAAIRTTHPAYFDNLRTALESGNHMKVELALRTGHNVLTKAAEKLYKLNARQLAKLQKQAANLSAEGKLNQQVVEDMAKDLQKNQFHIQRDSGTCVLLPTGVVCVLIVCLYCPIVVYVVAVEEMAHADSKLMTEQLVASICQLSVNPS